MAYKDNISRLSRLAAILVKLLSNSTVYVPDLAKHFEISERTIYRDLSALEQAGIPIIHQEGKQYALIQGYKLPPVMFTEEEANAIIFGEKLIEKTLDESLINAFQSASEKIRSVFNYDRREKVELLANRTIIGKNWANIRTSNHLSAIQEALTNYTTLKITYRKNSDSEPSIRNIEPFAIYHNTSEHWVVIAYCQFREEFRSFRIDRIEKLEPLLEKFSPHEMTMEKYVNMQKKKFLPSS